MKPVYALVRARLWLDGIDRELFRQKHSGLSLYDVRHDDGDWDKPISVELHGNVWVNSYGTLLSPASLSLESAIINSGNNWISFKEAKKILGKEVPYAKLLLRSSNL